MAADSSESKSIQLAQGCTVCTNAVLKGKITIGTGTIVHPRAEIIAESGPIIIGENNLIEENVQIINRSSGNKSSPTMTIGNSNVFEIGSRCEALNVGDNNVIQIKAVVGPDVEITNRCIIGTMCKVDTPETLPERTVIYGEKCLRRISATKAPTQNSMRDYLRNILPKYHYLMSPTKEA